MGYARKQADYAAEYGTTVRNIKRWVKCGRDKKDPCPLDSPGEMANWWARVMVWRVPDSLLALRGEGGQGAAAEVRAAELPGLGEDPPPETDAVAKDVPESRPLGSSPLDRLRRAEAEAAKEYFDALAQETVDDGQVVRLSRRWKEIGEQLRKYEKDAVSHAKATGDTYTAAEIRKELFRVHAVIAAGVRGMLRNVRPQLSGKLNFEQDAIWDDAVNRLFRVFQGGEFGGEG